MLRMDEIIDYGPCYVLAVHCPADGVSLPRKKVLYDVCDGATHESVYTFNTARQAKKFARHYVSDPKGTVRQKRQLSADRIVHTRALWALALLSSYMEPEMIITDKHKPHVTPERYVVRDIFPTEDENLIIVWYYSNDETFTPENLFISGIKSVRAIAENIFAFETYEGKVYTFIGKD